MQTSFTLAQLADPDTAELEKILRACVHCGFCTATCPTYVLDGNELDSPRGRIYLIKEMLEHDRPASADVTTHIDRCLSCLACMTTCPSGVHYMHLVDHARVHIEQTYRRPLADRLLRAMLAWLMPYPQRFRLALLAALVAKPFAPLVEALGLERLGAMLRLTPPRPPHSPRGAQTVTAVGPRKGRVALLAGCINDLAGAADQCLGDSRADAARLRRGAGKRGRLLRLAGSSHGPRCRSAGTGSRQYRCLGGARKSRRHCHHHIRLRHHGQRLRLHVPHRSRLCRARPEDLQSCQRHSGVSRRRVVTAGSRHSGTLPSPITPHVRCSTDRKFGASRKSCWRRLASL